VTFQLFFFILELQFWSRDVLCSHSKCEGTMEMTVPNPPPRTKVFTQSAGMRLIVNLTARTVAGRDKFTSMQRLE
jgi:hypothetical protein